MNRRAEPPDSLDFFPTPPWATRALFEHVLSKGDLRQKRIWEPAAGEDHMSDVIAEYAGEVVRSDVFDYGRGHLIGSFVGQGLDVLSPPASGVDWIVTNPPFNKAVQFALRGLSLDLDGFALLLRSNWSEGGTRYEELFSVHPPSVIAQFSERVPMTKGRWDPEASTMTSYSWFVWSERCNGTNFVWIPPVCRATLTKPDDHQRFALRGLAAPAPAPLFEGEQL